MPIRYFEPRELHDRWGKPAGRWIFTVRVDEGEPSPVGICSTECVQKGHASADDARECFKHYLLNQETTFDAEKLTSSEPCQRCGAPADWRVNLSGKLAFPLCDSHRNFEGIEPLLTFKDGETPMEAKP